MRRLIRTAHSKISEIYFTVLKTVQRFFSLFSNLQMVISHFKNKVRVVQELLLANDDNNRIKERQFK